jgi:hypothetical protein
MRGGSVGAAIPSQAGIQCFSGVHGKIPLDPGLRRDDDR